MRFLAIFWMLVPFFAFAQQGVEERLSAGPIITVVGSDEKHDTRYMYESDFVKLLLDKSVEEFGPYQLAYAPSMTHSRAIAAVANDTIPNFVRTFGYDERLLLEYNMRYVSYPVFRGLLGFRTCFLSEKIAKKFAQANTREALLKFTHGQGLGWADGFILASNGYTVFEIPNYISLFKMVSKNRFDLFCRGVTEVKNEYDTFGSMKGLVYDRTKSFYYPMPHFLHTNKKNREVVLRLEYGLAMVKKDGALDALWQRYHNEVLAFANLTDRDTIILDNPSLEGFNVSYEKYYPVQLFELIKDHYSMQ